MGCELRRNERGVRAVKGGAGDRLQGAACAKRRSEATHRRVATAKQLAPYVGKIQEALQRGVEVAGVSQVGERPADRERTRGSRRLQWGCSRGAWQLRPVVNGSLSFPYGSLGSLASCFQSGVRCRLRRWARVRFTVDRRRSSRYLRTVLFIMGSLLVDGTFPNGVPGLSADTTQALRHVGQLGRRLLREGFATDVGVALATLEMST